MNMSLYIGPRGKPLTLDRGLSALDWRLIGLLLLMIGFGLVVLQSASITFAESRYGDPFFFLKRQLVAVALGAAIATWIVLRLTLEDLERLAPLICLAVLVGLIVVLIPGVGHEVNGARRWISAPSAWATQPAMAIVRSVPSAARASLIFFSRPISE